jgi:hypothetical protein
MALEIVQDCSNIPLGQPARILDISFADCFVFFFGHLSLSEIKITFSCEDDFKLSPVITKRRYMAKLRQTKEYQFKKDDSLSVRVCFVIFLHE